MNFQKSVDQEIRKTFSQIQHGACVQLARKSNLLHQNVGILPPCDGIRGQLTKHAP